jgi:hypothetical protein
VKGHPAVYGPRFSRRNAKSVSFVQQPNDLQILEVLSLFRLLPAALITRLLAQKLSLVQSGLLRLYKHGYLQRFKGGTPAIIYAPAWMPRSKGSTLDHDCMAVRMGSA